jgi:hypothetical protein
MTTDDDNETYSGPVTTDQWAQWCRANGRPVPNWADVWSADE